ncbi:MAG: DUF5107 domain-containing protein [Anaerolineae bacterium]|nr:DUF5107 domain-containing protein [Anaerolineae bacterium]
MSNIRTLLNLDKAPKTAIIDRMKKRLPGPPGGPLLIFLLSFCIACRAGLRQVESEPGGTSAALLRVRSTPEGAALLVNGEPRGQTPADLPLAPGEWRLELSHPGYAAYQTKVLLAAGSVVSVPVSLRDVAPPALHWGELPEQLEAGAPLLVQASADDNAGVARLGLLIDGELHAETAGASLAYRWDTAAAPAGEHLLRLEASDGAGNSASAERSIVVVPVAQPTSSPSPTATPGPLTSHTAPVTVGRGTVEIQTYQYRQGLRSDPASPSYPYPGLDRSQVGPPVPVAYETVTLENEYLRLVFLPALGGRLYQCTYLPTGQDVFYNNAVLKPSPWGPPEMGWWLAAGGMEWCLPVEEHGYVSAEPWEAEVRQESDGSASVRLAHTERTHNIRAEVTVALVPGQARFTVSTRLENPDGQPKQYQYWLNAMLSPGTRSLSPSTRFLLPTSEVVIHSTGDASLGGPHSTITWPVSGDRDLGVYESWRNYLGVFAPAARAGYMGAYSPEADLGIARVFPRETVPGVKLFAFGRGFDPIGYTDGGTQYAELWGGVTPTFWDWATLPAHGTVAWTEAWLPVHALGGLSGASAEAAFLAVWDGAEARLAVTTPRVRSLVVTVSDDSGELYRQACTTGPEQPFKATVRPERAMVGALTLRIAGVGGALLAEHVMGPR